MTEAGKGRVTIHFNVAGLVCFCWGRWSLHLLVRPAHWTWGYEESWYDGPIREWGFGPLFMLNNYW